MRIQTQNCQSVVRSTVMNNIQQNSAQNRWDYKDANKKKYLPFDSHISEWMSMIATNRRLGIVRLSE